MDRDDLVSTGEAARRLGYTPQHVRRLLRERVLDGYRVGRDWLIYEASVSNYAASEAPVRRAISRTQAENK